MNFGILGLTKQLIENRKDKKQQGAITGKSVDYNIYLESEEAVNEFFKNGGVGNNSKYRNSDVNFNYISDSDNAQIENSPNEETSKSSSLFGKSQSESGTGSLTSQDPTNLNPLGRNVYTDTDGGDYDSKEGINTNMLLIVGGVVLLGIFVLPMFMGGKK